MGDFESRKLICTSHGMAIIPNVVSHLPKAQDEAVFDCRTVRAASRPGVIGEQVDRRKIKHPRQPRHNIKLLHQGWNSVLFQPASEGVLATPLPSANEYQLFPSNSQHKPENILQGISKAVSGKMIKEFNF
jgi:hypothetical protein